MKSLLGMKLLFALMAWLPALLPAQQISQLPVCVAFNDVTGATPAPLDCCSTQASVSFVAQSALVATEVEVYVWLYNGLNVSVSESVGGLSVSGAITPQTVGNASVGRWLTVPVPPLSVAAGATCTLTLQPPPLASPGQNPLTLYTNPNGNAPLLVTPTCQNTLPCPYGTIPCQQPPSLVNLMFRLRGPACTGGVPSTITTVGGGCGPIPPVLTAPFFPVVGSTYFYLHLSNAASPGIQAHLFFAEGQATAGTPVEPGHPCLLHLNPVSLANLNSLGYEPLVSAQSNGLVANFGLPIPALPQLIGLVVTFQAAILDPASGIPLSTLPGMSLKASNGLTLTIGG